MAIDVIMIKLVLRSIYGLLLILYVHARTCIQDDIESHSFACEKWNFNASILSLCPPNLPFTCGLKEINSRRWNRRFGCARQQLILPGNQTWLEYADDQCTAITTPFVCPDGYYTKYSSPVYSTNAKSARCTKKGSCPAGSFVVKYGPKDSLFGLACSCPKHFNFSKNNELQCYPENDDCGYCYRVGCPKNTGFSKSIKECVPCKNRSTNDGTKLECSWSKITTIGRNVDEATTHASASSLTTKTASHDVKATEQTTIHIRTHLANFLYNHDMQTKISNTALVVTICVLLVILLGICSYLLWKYRICSRIRANNRQLPRLPHGHISGESGIEYQQQEDLLCDFQSATTLADEGLGSIETQSHGSGASRTYVKQPAKLSQNP